ncbi:MAG: mechanosensitive ion channel domain-containing protein [Desertimonas sp.]
MPALLLVAAIVVGALALLRVSRQVLRRVVRQMADRSRSGDPTRWWRATADRTSETAESTEQRRRQRIDAAARMLNHVVALVVWVVATIAVFRVLHLDATFFLSGAGFLGAAAAIGGQHKVNDYLTGLSVLFEDRYGVGDELLVDVGRSEPIHAVVDHIGLVTTRLRDERGTVHVPNATIGIVRNLSQETVPTTLRIHVAEDIPGFEAVSERAAADTLRRLAGTEQLTDVVFVGDLAAHRGDHGDIDVDVRTLRPLTTDSRRRLVERAEQMLRVEA